MDAPSDTLPCGWLSLSVGGQVLEANPFLCTLLGLDRRAVDGSHFDQLLSPAPRLIYQSYLQPLLRLHGQVAELALSLKHADGTPTDVLVYTRRSTLEPDAPLHLVLAPLKQRRRIEDELLRVKRAADQAPGMIFQLVEQADGSMKFAYVSEAVRTLYAVTQEAAQHSAAAVFDCILPEDRSAVDAARPLAGAGDERWSIVYRVRRPDGSISFHELVAAPRRLAHRVTLWHGHVADVTQRRQLEQAVTERDALRRIDKSRSDLLARVSHELRTPLNGILGFAQVLQRDEPANLLPVQVERIGLIERTGQHLLQLVDQVLEVSRLESVALAVALEACPVHEQVAQALQTVKAQAERDGISLAVSEATADLSVLANPLKLQQVLLNLLSNAIKYNRPGGSVRVSWAVHDGGVQLEVRDSGVGLTDAQLDELFQPFNRLGAERTGREGFGLGLVITKHLMGLMGGRIVMVSQSGEGSAAQLWLQGADRVAARPRAPGAGQLPDAATARKTHGRVLYVEDDPVNAVLMQAIVGMRPGIELRVAVDGAQALAEVQDWVPELLLLDMHLPDTTGSALLARLRDLPALRVTPALVVSAAARVEDIERAQAHGFSGYWTKPLDVDRTLRELDAWLGGDAAARGS